MRSILTVCLFSICYCTGAQNQNGAQADTINTTLLSEITVSANRWEQSKKDVPQQVVTITKSTIDFQNPQTAADLLIFSDKVFVQKSQLGGGSPMIRGFATNRVMLVVDGVRMNNAIFRAGNVQNVISLDANAIEKTEVLFGPGSVMYGSDAIGGVMDFHTLSPKFSTKNSLAISGNGLLRYSSANNERAVHADVSLGLKKWAFVTSMTRSIYDDLKMGSNGPAEYTRPDYVVRVNGEDRVEVNDDPNVQKFSGYNQWNLMQKISFKPADKFRIDGAFHYSKTSDYPRYDRLILKEDGDFANAEWYYGPQKWIMGSLTLNYSQPSEIFDNAKLIIAYQDYEESRHNRGFGGSNRTDRTENVKAFSVNGDFSKELSGTSQLIYGAELIANKVNSTAGRVNVNNGAPSSATTRYPDDSQWRSLAAYAGVRVRPIENFATTISARITNVRTHADFDLDLFPFPFSEATVNNSAVNGSLGVVYNPTSTWKIYSNLSTGFRAPNVDDVGKVFDSAPGEVVVPNADLEAEYAYNAEIGFASTIAQRLEMDLAGYYTIIDNAIARGPSTFNGRDSIVYDDELSRVLALQNISRVWVSGLQIGLNWRMTEEFSLRSNLNYQHGKEKDPETNRNNPPTHVAPLFGSTHFLFKRARVSVDLYSNYNGKIAFEDLALSERADSHLYAKDENGNPYSPSWWTLNLKSSFIVTKTITADVGLENLLDKRYRPYSSGITAPGRNVIASIRIKF
jgi:hemoglobin/transferrin/lactoferrin receptor protein